MARLLVFAAAVALAAGPQSSQNAGGQTPIGLDEFVPAPPDNPITQAKVGLGRRLFFDTLLSIDGRISCGTCHQPSRAFTDGRDVAVGARGRRGTRNVPTILNRAYGRAFFWDGRALTLEEQVLSPIENPFEMALPLPILADRLRQSSSYRDLFEQILGEPPSTAGAARALATFVRAQRSGGTPFDAYRSGSRDALSTSAARGLQLFRGKAHCASCHSAPNFTDEDFHNTGVSVKKGDPGRVRVTGRERDSGAFKTPTLRQLRWTAPYMHDGSIQTLAAVIEFYDRGGGPNPNLDSEVRPLHLTTTERQDLIAFLNSLSTSSGAR